MPRLRVALILPSIGVGETVETPALSGLVESLAPHVDISVFTLRYPPRPATYNVNGIPVTAIGGEGVRVRRLVPRTLRAIRAEHQRQAFDVMHGVWLFEPGFVAALAGRLLRVPSLASIGGVEVTALPDIGVGGLLRRRGRLMNRLVLNQAGLVSGGSRYVLHLAQRLAPRRNVGAFRFAPLPVRSECFSPRRNAPAGAEINLLHVANLIPVKDQVTLLRAFALVHAARPQTRLTIAGADPFGVRFGLEELVQSLGVAEAIEFRGLLPHDRLPELYRSADIFVLSSRHESQAVVVLEAAASGVPTVGTAVGVVPDLAPEAALASPVRDAGALAANILRLVDAPDLRAHMGQAALARARSVYDYQPAARRFLNLYEELALGLIARDDDQ